MPPARGAGLAGARPRDGSASGASCGAKRTKLAVAIVSEFSSDTLNILPRLRTTSLETEKGCLIGYEALGWLGYVPRDCRNSLLIVPVEFAPWLWGWPNRFLRRMHHVGTDVFVAERLKSGGLKGIDSDENLNKLPPGYSGGIWTDRIDIVGPALARRK
jgi:glycerophosphoryl diester phosphodiesterase